MKVSSWFCVHGLEQMYCVLLLPTAAQPVGAVTLKSAPAGSVVTARVTVNENGRVGADGESCEVQGTEGSGLETLIVMNLRLRLM